MMVEVGSGGIRAPTDVQLMFLLAIFYFALMSVIGLSIVDSVEALLELFKSIKIFEDGGEGEIFGC